jgi:hypothetical protein
MICTVYHVTSPVAAKCILEEGFAGSYGDDGFGVYLFEDLADASGYALNGGWDGSLDEAVILEVKADVAEIFDITIDPSWPNPEDYDGVLVHYMDEDDEDARWVVDVKIIPCCLSENDTETPTPCL